MEREFCHRFYGNDALASLQIESTRVEAGRVRFTGSVDDLYRSLIELRCASRLVREIESVEVTRENQVYDVVRAIPWHDYFSVDATFRVTFRARSALVRHSRFWTYRIKDAVCDAFVERCARRPDVDTSAPQVHIYCWLENRRLSVGLDAAGDPLSLRGYRAARHDANLSEQLAAAMVLRSGWDGSTPLHDPFCGSATILIEAAWIATRTPPTTLRTRFAVEQWADFDPNRFASLRAQASRQRCSPDALSITGGDTNASAIRGAERNIERAGLTGCIHVRREPVGRMPPILGGAVITNPPYGKRLGEPTDLQRVYRELRQRVLLSKGSTVVVLNAGESFERVFSLRPTKKNRMSNGGIPCTLYQYQIHP